MVHLVVLDTENPGVKGFPKNKTKGETVGSGPLIGSAQRRKLADISNLQDRGKQPNHGAKQQQQAIPLSSKEYMEKLQKENMTLMKVLMDRNKLIELSGIELQKLRISLQKVQEQNLQLAQANSQMLAELNTNKDRLKALQHELGCKNGLLKARNMQEQTNPKVYQTCENKVGTINHSEAGEFFQADNGDSKNTRRRRQSKIKCNSNVESVQVNENANKKRKVSGKSSSKSEEPDNTDISIEANQKKEKNVGNKRQCIRRQSARFKSQEPELTENLHEIDDVKETTENERLSLRRQSTRIKSQAPEPTESLHEIHDVRETAKDKRLSLRRQSTRIKPQPPGPTESLHEMHDTKEIGGNERPYVVTRQSSRFESQASITTNEVTDSKFPDPPSCDDMAQESNQPPSVYQKDHKEEVKSSFGTDDTETMRRTSVGRPARQAAEKVQSYKEVSLKVKMRRID